MIVFSTLSYFNRTLMSVAAPTLMRQFGLSETQMGTVFSAFLLSYALLMIPGGRLADRFGPRATLTLAGLGAGIAIAMTAFCGNPGLGGWIGVQAELVLVRFALGVATAPLYPACARMNANWIPFGTRARVQGFISAGAGLGGAGSPFIFLVIANAFGWRTEFLIAGLLTAAVAIIWRLTVFDYPPGSVVKQKPSGPSKVWKELFGNRGLLLLAGGYFAVCYFEYIFFYWAYYYFGTVRHMTSRETTLYTTILFLAWTVMTPFGGWISDGMVSRLGPVWGRRTVPMVSLLTSGAALVIGINLPGTAATGTALALALGFAAASDGPFWAAAIDLGGKDAGAASGLLNSIGNLGGALSPVITAMIAAQTGWKMALYSASLLAIASVALWLFVGEARQEQIVPTGQFSAGHE